MPTTDNGSSDRLNARQEAFCLHYAESGNATQAYKAAYGKMSDNAAAASAARLLNQVKILKRIKELRDQTAAPRIKSIAETQAILSELLTDESTPAGTKVSAARTLLQSLGAFDRENQQQINLYSNADGDGDTVIILPPMLQEKDCEWYGGDDDDNIGITKLR